MTAFVRTALLQTGETFEILVNGGPVVACEGDSVAAALLAAGWLSLAAVPNPDRPHSFFCGMGICYGCLVTIDGQPNVRSCATRVRPGQRVELEGYAAG